MNDTAIIISAITALVGAVAGLVVAVSKLEPVLKAANKMLADHHKRAKEARKSEEAKRPVARSAGLPDPPGPTAFRFPTGGLVWLCASLLYGIVQLLVLAGSPAPVTTGTVAVCL